MHINKNKKNKNTQVILKKFYLKVFFCLLFFNYCLSQKLDNKLNLAFGAINDKNYFKAKKILEKTLKKEPVASSFGLSIILSSKNSFYNIDSAFNMITKCNNEYKKLELTKKQYLIRFSVHTKTIKDETDKIINLHFQRTKDRNSVDAYQAFINKFSPHPTIKTAKELMSLLVFNKIKNDSSELSFKNFISNYPNSSMINEAKKIHNLLIYKNMTKSNSLDSFEKYLEKFPNGDYIEQAKLNVYKLYTKTKRLEDYESFIKSHPNNPKVNEAWNHIYKKFFRCRTTDELKIFIKRYPNFPNKSLIEEDKIFINKSMLAIKKDGKYGFIDSKGKIIIQPKYDFVGKFKCGLALCGNNIKVGYINKKEDIIIPFVYDEGYDFIDGIAIVDSANFLGIIDIHNKKILPFRYERIIRFLDNILIVKEDNYFKILDNNGKKLLDLKFDDIKIIGNSLACSIDGKYGLLNQYLETKSEFIYDDIKSLNQEDKFITKVRDKYGIINIDGEELKKTEYKHIGSLESGMILFIKNKKYGYFDKDLKIKIKAKYKTYKEPINNYYFKGKYALIKLKNKYGLIDKSGKIIIPRMFDKIINTDIFPIPCNKKRGKWGYVNKKLILTIKHKYQYASPFIDSIAIVSNKKGFSLINKEGEKIIPTTYNYIDFFDYNLLIISNQEDMKGIIDRKNNIIIQPKYIKIESLKNGLIKLYSPNDIEYFNVYKNKFLFKNYI